MRDYMQRCRRITKEKKLSKTEQGYEVTVTQSDFNWLMSNAEALCEIADEWIRIEEQGTKEEADDFYSYVQDALTGDGEESY
ncbi:hypothetical protein DMN77_08130 [Paenibacillus sp. 79R4]|uniref:hypothetical protein n=1 Tax=Paenibacillus sp. 79R4 TaxID=2212847 RepID=UPI0015BD7D8D|nr:hypothetical protein [Paenibacillus sp. 79R4]NWL87571.1 hypothetical protein [Paenibacillus sp. 79R4]